MTVGIGTSTGSGGDFTVILDRSNPALVCTKDSEISLVEITPDKDEEVELYSAEPTRSIDGPNYI